MPRGTLEIITAYKLPFSLQFIGHTENLHSPSRTARSANQPHVGTPKLSEDLGKAEVIAEDRCENGEDL
jgi:hypothetical protein